MVKCPVRIPIVTTLKEKMMEEKKPAISDLRIFLPRKKKPREEKITVGQKYVSLSFNWLGTLNDANSPLNSNLGPKVKPRFIPPNDVLEVHIWGRDKYSLRVSGKAVPQSPYVKILFPQNQAW